jgi:hypothetical protein
LTESANDVIRIAHLEFDFAQRTKSSTMDPNRPVDALSLTGAQRDPLAIGQPDVDSIPALRNGDLVQILSTAEDVEEDDGHGRDQSRNLRTVVIDQPKEASGIG